MSFGVSPFVWFGGKQRLARRIVDLLPPHLVYVEPFGGAAAVLLTKAPSRLEVYNDADGNLVNFFRVLRDEPEELERRLRLTPFARSEFRDAVAHWRADFAGIDDPIERARLFWVRIELSFAGYATTVGWGGEFAGRRRGSKAWTSHTKLDRLERISARFRGVQIEHLKWPEVFDRYDGPDAVFYVDPPYVPETRKKNKQAGGKAYPHDLTSVDHEALVERLLTLRGGALISGYHSDLYRPLEEAGFERFEFAAMSAAANTAGADASRTEVVWRRVPDVEALFGSLAEAVA